jgi:hypothetical protein
MTPPEFAQVFSGNVSMPGMQPFATNCDGRQFAYWPAVSEISA